MSAADHRIPGWQRAVGVLAVIGTFAGAYWLSPVFGDDSGRLQILSGATAIALAIIVLAVWMRLPERAGPQGRRFNRTELVRATVSVICVVGAVGLPGILQHGMSLRTWILLPIVLVVSFIGFVVVERREDERIDDDLAEWRRLRPHPRPKAR